MPKNNSNTFLPKETFLNSDLIYQENRQKILSTSNEFFNSHGLRLKVRRLPVPSTNDFMPPPNDNIISSSSQNLSDEKVNLKLENEKNSQKSDITDVKNDFFLHSSSSSTPSSLNTSILSSNISTLSHSIDTNSVLQNSSTSNSTITESLSKTSLQSASVSSATNSMDNTLSYHTFEFPVYHFVTRQKRHLPEQLMRNRSMYHTQFNSVEELRNIETPYYLKEMPSIVKNNLIKMANDFDDPEFSGVWLSLHSTPSDISSPFGHILRSKIIGWALIEVLTTNERCLKALWVHPQLSAHATSELLKGFLPRVLFEAFELTTPQNKDMCPWKFFYAWLNDFDIFPRQTWLLLCGKSFFDLPMHYDLLAESASTLSGHIDKGQNPDEKCPCQKSALWDDYDQVLVGCTENYMYLNLLHYISLIPESSDSLREGIKNLENEVNLNKVNDINENLASHEIFNLSNEEIKAIITKVYGEQGKKRLKEIFLENLPDVNNKALDSSNI